MHDTSDHLNHAAAVTDRELVGTMRLPDSDAFTVLFHRHIRAVHSYLTTALGCRDAADHVPSTDIDDVLQETFATAWMKLTIDQLSGASALPWLLATAQHKASNLKRARGRSRLSSLEEITPSLNDATTDTALRRERTSALADALDDLAPQDRRIVQLCLSEGLLYKEAAAATHSTPSAVRNRLHRARTALRNRLAPLMEDPHE